MRALTSLVAGFAVAAFVALASGGSAAYASFHCMRIHAVLRSYNGNANIQYVELRMNAGAQVFLGSRTIEFRDATGVLKATFTFPPVVPFGPSVPNFAVGDSILIGTSQFNAAVTGGAADFVFTALNTVGSNGGDPLHPVQGPGGKIAFAQGFDNCDADIVASPGEVDSLAYGTTTGSAAPDFGTAAAALPPTAGNGGALRLFALNAAPGPVNNSAEYGLAYPSTLAFSVLAGNLITDLNTPRNNGRTVLALPALPQAVGGVASAPDQSLLASPAASAWRGHRTAYEFGAGAAAAAALGAAGWAARRKRTASD
jgi:hypothetical protein